MNELRKEIDSHYTRDIAGTSVEVETDSSPEREQTVKLRSLPKEETPREFHERMDQE